MFLNNKNANAPASAVVTIIGTGARIEGKVAFAGYLRVQGEIVGDVSSDADGGGTVVVHGSGRVTGTIEAPNVIVSGRVVGPVHASQSIEVHQGARVTGDAHYTTIAVHPGGVIEGSLVPAAALERARTRQEHRVPMAASPDVEARELPAGSDAGSPREPRGGGKLAAATALLAVLVAGVFWVNRNPAADAPPPAAVAPEAAASVKLAPAAQSSATVASEATPAAASAALAEAGPAAPPVLPTTPAPRAKAVVPTPAPERREADAERVVTVQGMSAAKPAGAFFVVGKGAAVLFRKQRTAPGDGTRIEVARGHRARFAIAQDELVRVGEGRNVEIFYQGRKVAPKTIESGAWISFVPQSPGDAR